jgi:Uma2 family endonuclease
LKDVERQSQETAGSNPGGFGVRVEEGFPMSINVAEILAQAPPLYPQRRRWTRAEWERIEADGLLGHERLELIEGDLITRMPKKPPHMIVVVLLHEWLMRLFGPRFVTSEATIDVAPEDNPTSWPEPDVIVLNRDFTRLLTYSQPADLELVVEVSDTTLRFDLTVKAGLYARAAIREYWVVDIAGRRMIVHREPGDGRYASITVHSEEESVSPLASPSHSVTIGELLPPATR